MLLAVDIGNTQHVGTAIHKIFVKQVLKEKFTEPAAADNGDIAIPSAHDARALADCPNEAMTG